MLPASTACAAHPSGRRDDQGRQKKSFAKKVDADRFNAKITTDLTTGEYIDPKAGKVTREAYAEQWRRSLVVDPTTLASVTSRLKVRLYPHIGYPHIGFPHIGPRRWARW